MRRRAGRGGARDAREHALTPAEAAVLLAATEGAVGEAARLGATMATSADSFGGGRAGAASARWSTRFTRPRTASAEVDVAYGAEVVREILLRHLAERGEVIADPNAAGDGTLWGLVRSGVWDMMPALVCVAIEPVADGRSRVRVRATGREGLIAQRIAGRAIDRIHAALGAHGP